MRIQYIDALKGLAIILVVVRHVAEHSLGINGAPFSALYNGYHMPLFFFLSGLFAFKNIESISWQTTIDFFKKKAVRILLPFFVIAPIYSYVVSGNPFIALTGEFNGYWFLPAIFHCMVLGLIYVYIYILFKHQRLFCNSFLIEFLPFVLVYGASICFYQFVYHLPFALSTLKQFPFFIAGHWFLKHGLLTSDFTSKQSVLTTCIILFAVTMVFERATSFHAISLPAIFAIVIFIHLFKTYQSKLPNWLSFVGKYTMEIYVLHWFFLPQLGGYSSFFEQNFNQNLIIVLMICFFVSVFIIALTLLMAFIIRQSNLLSYLCFGTNGVSQKK